MYPSVSTLFVIACCCSTTTFSKNTQDGRLISYLCFLHCSLLVMGQDCSTLLWLPLVLPLTLETRMNLLLKAAVKQKNCKKKSEKSSFLCTILVYKINPSKVLTKAECRTPIVGVTSESLHQSKNGI